MLIRVENPIHDDVIALLAAHLENMHEISPPDSVHALDLDELRSAEITLWSAWDADELLGCGALKELDARHGEIKSMRTADRHVGKGVASTLLEHMIRTARGRGYERLSLETGTEDEFEPAYRLYLKYGFEDCEPFGDYRIDPHSRFMTLEISD